MGEIGIPRREFLYDIRYWEANRIVRGYRRRDRLKHQLMAECAFAAIYAMRDPKGKTPMQMFPGIFEDDDEDDDDPDSNISEQDAEQLRELMRQENARLAAERGEK